ncbi:MAG TPA: TRAP transporter substrate-binding protein [Ktedonosporobacter sp.]|nr:TRAP transporter substrate-binding protein [Ktedonosporobacter sp.]
MKEQHTSRRSLLKYGLGTMGAAALFPLGLDACGPAPATTGSSATGGATVTLKMSSSLTVGVNSAHWVWYNKFQELLDQKTNKRIKIQYFPNNQLGQEADVIKLVKLGTVDMMISGSSIWSTFVPEFSVLDMGYIFNDLDSVGRVLDGQAGTSLSKLMADQVQVNIIGWSYSFGARNVCTKKPVKVPSDLNGMKIRVLPVKNFVATLKLMGAVATPIAFGEVYTSLQTGVIDGLEHDFPTILANKFYEIAKNITLTEHIYNPNITTINQQSMAKIPADLHDAFLQAAQEATVFQRQQATSTSQKAKDTLVQNGMTIYPIDRAQFKQKVQPLWTSFTAQYPDTKPILDSILSS